MKFVIDANLPVELVDWLQSLGHEAAHVVELGIEMDDDLIWENCLAENAIVLTKDSDFAKWARARSPAPKVVWLRTGNLRKRQQLAHVRRSWLNVLTQINDGVAVIEVR